MVISSGVFAQKTSKKYSERFNTDKDVEVQINASNTEIDVSTWNKNEVLVEAYIDIEGISKEKAGEYLKKYQFEALGNKKTVKINARGNGFRFDTDFVIFNKNNFSIPEIVIPEIPDMSNLVIPEIGKIEIPEIDFDFDDIVIDFDNFEFDKDDKSDDKITFKWEEDGKEIVIKSRKEWEKFKKSPEYKNFKEKMSKESKKLKKELSKLKVKISKEQKEKIKESLEKARKEIKKIDMDKIRSEVRIAGEKMKKEFDFTFDSDNKEVTIDGKKVKIQKRIVIKVPKDATFDLNTRHCKVKLPKSKASGKVSYGSFKSEGMQGGKLNISFSPVTISDINASSLFLNNVTDASLASVTNSEVKTNSGSLKIQELLNNVDLSSSYGDIRVLKVSPDVENLSVDLKHADAFFNFLNFPKKLVIATKDNKSRIVADTKTMSNKVQGSFSVKSSNELIKILGLYSELIIKK